MRRIKVAGAVLNQTPMDWTGNHARISRAIGEARDLGVTLLCLPEMCIPSYGCEDAFHAPGVQQTSLEMLNSLLPETEGMLVTFGLPLMVRNGLFNVVCLVVDGKIAGFVGKRHLAGDGIHYEPRWFNPWPANAVDQVKVFGEVYPVGDIHFDCGDVRLGFEICEDAWVARRPGSALALRGIDVILNPSASHFAFGKIKVRRRFVIEGSRAFGCSYIYSNLLGNDAGRVIYDGGVIVASAGRLLAQGPRLTFDDVLVTDAVIDITLSRTIQARTHSFRPEFPHDARDLCIDVDFDWPPCGGAEPPLEVPAWERLATIKEEEFTRAISLSLYDYMRKSYSRGFVISLSGGADSAACAVLVSLMVRLGIASIGRQRFLEKLSYFRSLADCDDAKTMVSKLLVCAYQATVNSSSTTENAARMVAEAIGAEYLKFDVDDVVDDYVGLISKALGRELSWDTDDIALQNIQARVRAPSVWMLANIRNALLVATSNRSEAAVGYATMDGDTSGGISPIAGIDKAFLRQWLRWMETAGPDGFEPVAALNLVNVQAPTAELRPQDQKQTDEDDLMPYPLLDAIEKAGIRDKRMPDEVFELMSAKFPQYSTAQLGVWVERFFKLWCRNQWKRERYAPSFHVDDENLDPKTWCRFPILSGGFTAELAELRALVRRREAQEGN